MAQITKAPFLRQLRADASSHVQQFRNGRRVRSGRGLSFWFLPGGSSLTEIPMDDRLLTFALKGQSADYQDLTVQGTITWRVADPERLGDRVDFTIDQWKGDYAGEPLDQIRDRIGSEGRRMVAAYVKRNRVRDILQSGVAPLQTVLAEGFAANPVVAGLGLEVASVGVDSIAPSSELARALQAPTFESLQQQADEASFARRALAVEKERAIAENELRTKTELEAQRRQLLDRADENARAEAGTKAAALAIAAEAEAGRIRAVDQARVDMERARIATYAELPPAVLLAMAAQEFAGKLKSVDNLTITPDLLAGAVGQLRGLLAPADAPGGGAT